MEKETINSYDKELFDRIIAKKASVEEVENSLGKLTQLMYLYYGKPVILLLDEYDVPLAKASEKGYYAQMLDIMRGLLQVIKDNDALKFAVVTGCLRIAKESIFTGTNNFVSDTISDTRLNEYFGFTQAEIDRLLTDTGLADHAEIMKAWYDGYHFGDCDVYCLWDVMNHVNHLMLDPGAEPAGYWKNSSDNAIIRSFLVFSGESVTQRFETLLAGGTIVQKVKDDLTYGYVASSEENLWSILYLTGYLTRVRNTEAEEALPKGILALKIPNVEIMEIFEATIKGWFEESTQKLDRNVLFSAIWNGDAKKVAEMIEQVHRDYVSVLKYNDENSLSCVITLAYFHAIDEYHVFREFPSGEGFADIVFLPRKHSDKPAMVVELKYNQSAQGPLPRSKTGNMQESWWMVTGRFC